MSQAEVAERFSLSKAKSDYSDVKFVWFDPVSNTDKELFHWFENDEKVWVNVPELKANSTETLYMYYGNSAASSQPRVVYESYDANEFYTDGTAGSGSCSTSTNAQGWECDYCSCSSNKWNGMYMMRATNPDSATLNFNTPYPEEDHLLCLKMIDGDRWQGYRITTEDGYSTEYRYNPGHYWGGDGGTGGQYEWDSFDNDVDISSYFSDVCVVIPAEHIDSNQFAITFDDGVKGSIPSWISGIKLVAGGVYKMATYEAERIQDHEYAVTYYWESTDWGWYGGWNSRGMTNATGTHNLTAHTQYPGEPHKFVIDSLDDRNSCYYISVNGWTSQTNCTPQNGGYHDQVSPFFIPGGVIPTKDFTISVTTQSSGRYTTQWMLSRGMENEPAASIGFEERSNTPYVTGVVVSPGSPEQGKEVTVTVNAADRQGIETISSYEFTIKKADGSVFAGPVTQSGNEYLFTPDAAGYWSVEVSVTDSDDHKSDVHSTQVVVSGWWNSNWSYRIPVTLTDTSGSNLIDYQVAIEFDSASLVSSGLMNADCSDLRFADVYGIHELSYWVESGCNTSSTKVGVKVPSIPASDSETIYMYYGNPDALSASDKLGIFTVFNDFEDSFSTGFGAWQVVESHDFTAFVTDYYQLGSGSLLQYQDDTSHNAYKKERLSVDLSGKLIGKLRIYNISSWSTTNSGSWWSWAYTQFCVRDGTNSYCKSTMYHKPNAETKVHYDNVDTADGSEAGSDGRTWYYYDYVIPDTWNKESVTIELITDADGGDQGALVKSWGRWDVMYAQGAVSSEPTVIFGVQEQFDAPIVTGISLNFSLFEVGDTIEATATATDPNDDPIIQYDFRVLNGLGNGVLNPSVQGSNVYSFTAVGELGLWQVKAKAFDGEYWGPEFTKEVFVNDSSLATAGLSFDNGVFSNTEVSAGSVVLLDGQTNGAFTTNAIDPVNFSKWGVVTFSKTTPGSSTLTVDVLKASDDSVLIADVKNGQNISGLGATAIKLRANFTSGSTPFLDSWDVSYYSQFKITVTNCSAPYSGEVTAEAVRVSDSEEFGPFTGTNGQVFVEVPPGIYNIQACIPENEKCSWKYNVELA